MGLDYASSSDEWAEILVGRSVTHVDVDEMTAVLDDGTKLIIHPNSGCWGCANGNFSLVSLNLVENVITRVEATETTTKYGEVFSVNIYAAGWGEFFAVEGSAGNGFYGTGYQVEVSRG